MVRWALRRVNAPTEHRCRAGRVFSPFHRVGWDNARRVWKRSVITMMTSLHSLTTKLPPLLLLLVALLAPGAIYGHGSMAVPLSRSYGVFLENPQTPKSDAAKAAIAVAGTQAFYDWHEVNGLFPNHDYQARIPDGQLPGAGRAKYAGLNLARSDWPATTVASGPYTCVFYAATVHEPSYFEVYLTKEGYNPATPLRWSDLERLVNPVTTLDGTNYRLAINLPQRTGRHVLYVIWQRIDPAGEAFFSTSDVIFTTGGAPVPTTPPIPEHPAHSHTGAHLDITSDWGQGFVGKVTVQNTTSMNLREWTVKFKMPRNITNIWDAKIVSHEGNVYVIKNESWNGVVGSGASFSFGFQAAGGNGAVELEDFELNGLASSTTPPTAPNPPPTPPTPPTTPEPPAPPTTPTLPDPAPTTGSPNTTVRVGDASITFKVTNDWKSGFQGDVTIKNETSAPLKAWQIAFRLPCTIASIWNARVVSQSGDLITFDASPFSWNKDIPASGTVTFGFTGSPGNVTVAPSGFTFSAQGTVPTPPTIPTAPTLPTVPPVPQLSIADAVVTEPLTGSTTVNINLTLDVASTGVVTVNASTVNGTALAPGDYAGITQSIRFEPGQTLKTIPIAVNADTLAESDETFSVQLSNPSGATIARTAATVTIRNATAGATTSFNYAEALQKSLFFYDAQRAGKLPSNNRVNWRGNSTLTDGTDAGIDLSGGYFDAGDHVKFGLPLASSLTLLAWGGIEYSDAYSTSGQRDFLLGAVRWGTDWLIKAHPSANVLYGQVGTGALDHTFWGPPEVMTMQRPSYAITTAKPGSDLAGEDAAAFAAASILFKTEDPAYSATLLVHARQLYDFAYIYRGKYSDSIADAATAYNSYSGYNDELVWGAAWLYRATGEAAYLQKAETIYAQYYTNATLHWTHAWDDKTYGATVLLAQLTKKAIYTTAAEKWLNYWTVGDNGSSIKTTPGGLAWLDQWGSLRYAANTALLAFIYSDTVRDVGTRYHDFAKKQIDYALGANPMNRSYVVGFGNNPPINPHHRGAHGSWANDIQNPTNNRHIIYGALVGGPSSASDTAYTDDRSNYQTNEIALDYNAGFTGALARLVREKGGAPLVNFPIPEVPDDEFFVEASINQQGTGFTEIRALLNNRSSFPAAGSQSLSFRYYVDLSEAIAAGLQPSQIVVKSNYSQGAKVSALKVYDAARKIYYVEADFTGTLIVPGSSSTYRKEVQFRMSLPSGAPASAWNPANDYSYQGLVSGNSNTAKTVRIPVFQQGTLLGGQLP